MSYYDQHGRRRSHRHAQGRGMGRGIPPNPGGGPAVSAFLDSARPANPQGGGVPSIPQGRGPSNQRRVRFWGRENVNRGRGAIRARGRNRGRGANRGRGNRGGGNQGAGRGSGGHFIPNPLPYQPNPNQPPPLPLYPTLPHVLYIPFCFIPFFLPFQHFGPSSFLLITETNLKPFISFHLYFSFFTSNWFYPKVL